MVSVANAVVLRYSGNGPWEDATKWTPDNGTTYPGNLPGILDAARMNWGNNTVTVSSVVPTAQQVQAGVDEGGTLHVQSGGVVTSDWWSGPGVAGACTGTFNIDAGGTMNIGTHLWVGSGGVGNFGIANISGVINIGNMIGLGTIDAVNPTGGIGTVNVLDGGLLAGTYITPVTSIAAGSLLTVSGSGLATFTGDYVTAIQDFIDAGRIIGAVVPIYDEFGTVIQTNIVVPEPATMILLGLGGLLIRRRRA